MISLKDIAVETKQVEATYPGLPNFKVKVNYVSRKTSRKILDESIVDKWENGVAVKRQDDDKFLEAFVRTAIGGWEGLTVGDVEKLMLIETDADPETEVAFSVDNAAMLMRNSQAFDSWINKTVFELDTFRK
ncbi:hypothetical protein [Bacteriophage Eos]|nr:hypothetical protein [Bacteriophage Eos]